VGPAIGKVLIVCPVTLVNVGISVQKLFVYAKALVLELEKRVPQVVWFFSIIFDHQR
jgi:hypothetical protein